MSLLSATLSKSAQVIAPGQKWIYRATNNLYIVRGSAIRMVDGGRPVPFVLFERNGITFVEPEEEFVKEFINLPAKRED
jgi:hypothetical protein